MTRTEQFVGQSFFLLRCPLEKGILERKYWQLRSCRKAIVLSSDFEIFYKDREQFFFLFFFCTIDLNFLLDKNFWALNKIYMNYRTYYYPIIQYPQRNLFYFASLSRWRASFMRNEQEKKINNRSLCYRARIHHRNWDAVEFIDRFSRYPIIWKFTIFDDFYSTCFEKIWRKELFNDFYDFCTKQFFLQDLVIYWKKYSW